jgi:hypothetical protein
MVQTKRWVPLLCAFTGARVSEITQLREGWLDCIGLSTKRPSIQGAAKVGSEAFLPNAVPQHLHEQKIKPVANGPKLPFTQAIDAAAQLP